MIQRVTVLLLIAAFFCGTNAYAIWRVEFESKTVAPYETGGNGMSRPYLGPMQVAQQ